MQAILQFCLIAILLEEAFSSGVCYDNYACVKMRRNDLKIPNNNPMIKGEKDDASHSWYTHVNWLDNPDGNLSYYDKYWRMGTTGRIKLYEQGKLERYAWAEIARKALGLNNGYVKIPGKVRVNRNLFSGDKCIGINFDIPWPSNPDFYLFLEVTDKHHSFLKGYLVMNKQNK